MYHPLRSFIFLPFSPSSLAIWLTVLGFRSKEGEEERSIGHVQRINRINGLLILLIQFLRCDKIAVDKEISRVDVPIDGRTPPN